MSTNTTTIDPSLIERYGLSDNKPVYMIAVPKYHENLFKYIEKAHEWLAESEVHSTRMKWTEGFYTKKITKKEDYDRLEKLIFDLRTEKSELFIDKEFHPKPRDQSMVSYVEDFIKSKTINTHYTFKNFYRITVYPFGENVDSYLRTVSKESDTRKEYIIIPLYIRMKRGKTFSQSKRVVGVNETTGEVIIEQLNPKHFVVDKEPEVDEEKTKEMNEKMELLY